MLKVCGINDSSELGEDPTSKTVDRYAAVIPPIQSHLDVHTILSFSICQEKTIMVTRDGSIYGVGNNCDGQINRLLPQYLIDEFKQFEITDEEEHLYVPISASCGDHFTIYLVSCPAFFDKNKICMSYIDRSEKIPLFLNLGDFNPISLYGGCKNSAAIDEKGTIAFISSKSEPTVHFATLPDGEKATTVACCEKFLVALSSNGRTFESPTESEIKFTEVNELRGIEIKEVTGMYDHCFAVTKDGRVFGKGSNKSGQLGISKKTERVDNFYEITTLGKYKIWKAYAGIMASLFHSYDGKILASGENDCGQLCLEKANGGGVDSPVETLITADDSFCIVGNSTAVFIDYIPPNGPNKRIGCENDKKVLVEEKKEEKKEEKIQPKVEDNNSKTKEAEDTKKNEPAEASSKEEPSKCCLLI